MKKDIYTMLNDVSTDTSKYDRMELSEEELRKFRTGIRSETKKKQRRRSAYFAAVAACVCVVLVAVVYLSPWTEMVKALEQKDSSNQDSRAVAAANIEEARVKFEQTRRFDGGSVTLQSVSMGEGQMIIDTRYYFEDTEKFPALSEGTWWRSYNSGFSETAAIMNTPVISDRSKETGFVTGYEELEEKPYIQRLFIDGKEIRCLTDGNTFVLKKGMVQDTASYYFPVEELSFPAKVRLEIWENEKQSEPVCTFEFQLQKEYLIENEIETDFSQDVKLKDGRVLTFYRFIYNAQGAKVYASCENMEGNGEGTSPLIVNVNYDTVDRSDIQETFWNDQISEEGLLFRPQRVGNLYYLLRGEDGSERTELKFDVTEYYSQDSEDRSRQNVEVITQENAVKVPLE